MSAGGVPATIAHVSIFSEESEPFDLESEWPETRRGFAPADGEGASGTMWLFPVAVLYTGFFLGPFLTILSALFAVKWRISFRRAALMAGTAGTAWCLLQGLTAVYAASWSEYALMVMRSTFNFLNGVAIYVVIRPLVAGRMRPTWLTVVLTIALFALAFTAFMLAPPRFLVALGR